MTVVSGALQRTICEVDGLHTDIYIIDHPNSGSHCDHIIMAIYAVNHDRNALIRNKSPEIV